MNTLIKTKNGDKPYGFGSWLQLYRWFKEKGSEFIEGELLVHEYHDKYGDIQKNEYTVPYLKCNCFDEAVSANFTISDLRTLEMALHQSYNSGSSEMMNLKLKIREVMDLKYRLGEI